MRFGKFRVDGRFLAGVGVAAFLAVLLLWPWSRPHDQTIRLHVHPDFNTVQRALLIPKTRQPQNAWGRHGVVAFNPRSVTVKSDGAPFDAYVLELGEMSDERQIEFFLDASRRIEAGEKLPESSQVDRRLDATETTFGLAWLPFGVRANYLLIVHGAQPTEIEATVSYGGPAAP